MKSNERIGLKEMINLPSIVRSPISDYIIRTFDEELKGRRITFNEFLSYLGVLHFLCKPEYKNQFIFSMIDEGNKGHIDEKDIMGLINRLLKINSNAKDEESKVKQQRIYNYMKQVFQCYDPSGEQKIRKDVFMKIFAEDDMKRIIDLASLDFDWEDNPVEEEAEGDDASGEQD